jgi:aconitate hydratase
MGQAPAPKKISLRTVPRNFPGRSGNEEDMVYLCSPETAAASALSGKITDPRNLGMKYPEFTEPEQIILNTEMLVPPLQNDEVVELEKGPNIRPLPSFEKLPDQIVGPVLLKVKDNISTDEIMPAGAKILPYRSNIPELSKFVFYRVDENFYNRTMEYRREPFFIIGGENYGQGSSREHAAIAPRYLGLRCVVAIGFARIHWQNLINFGILPLTFADKNDYSRINQGDILALSNLHDLLKEKKSFRIENRTSKRDFEVIHALSSRQLEILLEGSLLNAVGKKVRQESHA